MMNDCYFYIGFSFVGAIMNPFDTMRCIHPGSRITSLTKSLLLDHPLKVKLCELAKAHSALLIKEGNGMVISKNTRIWLTLLCISSLGNVHADAPGKQRFFSEIITNVAYYFLGDVRAQYADHAYNGVQAALREGYDICDQEKAYVAQRAVGMQQAMQTLLGQPIDGTAQLPRIAFCCSGGGYRAMLATLGAMKGAQKIGLYDAALYGAGVSGGAWGLANMSHCGSSAAHCLEAVTSTIDESLLEEFNYEQVEQALLKQIAFTKRCSMIDFYGALLAQKLLQQQNGSNASDISLDQQAATLVPAQQLFPIYSGVFDAGDNHYEWVEFNPYEVSSVVLGSAIPAWAFGRTFNAGVSTDTNPAQSLGYCMGIWGSSFTANIKDIADSYLPEISSRLVAYLLGKLVQDLPDVVADERLISPAHLHNWNYGTALPFADRKHLELLDAGLECNLPLLPLLRKARDIDIIIIFDASLQEGAVELHKAEQYARDHNILFPPIDYSQTSQPCSVHTDWSDPRMPVIIYFPLVAQAGYCNGWDPANADFTSTFDFEYSYDEAMLLAGLMEYSLVHNKQTLIDTINRVISNIF